LATTAGLTMLARGGNAVDAAVAAAYVLMVVLPHACGLGGDALFLVSRDRHSTAFNGSGRIPRGWDGVLAEDGAPTATVPGAVAALDEAHQAYGVLTRSDVMAAAIAAAERGFAVTDDLVSAVARNRSRLEEFAEAAPYTADRVRPGRVLRQLSLATTLGRISDEGPAAFYRGPGAEALVTAAQAGGSALSLEDLEEHETARPVPAMVVLGSSTLTVAPPASQGVLAGMALRAMSGAPAASAARPRTHLLTEALEAAFQKRARLSTEPWESVLAEPITVTGGPAQRLGGARGTSHTTAVAVADGDGTIVSMLLSVFHEFGSAAYVPELGFVLNDRMRGLEAAPVFHDRPLHTLSPVILQHRGSMTALATPGADAQVQVIAQCVDGILAEELPLPDVLDRPRWRLQDQDLVVEGSMPVASRDLLSGLGHHLIVTEPGDRAFGSVVAAGFDFDAKTCFGAADLRRESTAGAI
jgi:gamma-glutamyltranspeptidase/glutathione hydrolase